jgi:hypothetical protein
LLLPGFVTIGRVGSYRVLAARRDQKNIGPTLSNSQDVLIMRPLDSYGAMERRHDNMGSVARVPFMQNGKTNFREGGGSDRVPASTGRYEDFPFRHLRTRLFPNEWHPRISAIGIRRHRSSFREFRLSVVKISFSARVSCIHRQQILRAKSLSLRRCNG